MVDFVIARRLGIALALGLYEVFEGLLHLETMTECLVAGLEV